MRQPASLKQDETETKKAENPVKNGGFRPDEAVCALGYDNPS